MARTPLLFLVLILALVMVFSPLALTSVLTDGLMAAGILAGAAGWGLACFAIFDGAGRWPWRWHAVGGAGLGVGLLCLALLTAGSAGWLQPAVWWAVLAAGWLLGAWRLRQLWPRPAPARPVAAGAAWPAWQSTAWLLLAPSAALVLLCATVPPGIIWTEEGRGYDVLEYHLQVPREFFDRGAVTALPHNIYSYFPLSAEMLSLLAMILRGDAQQAAIAAQLINAGLAFLLVAAAWLAGRESGPGAGLVAGLLAGSAPWITYLSGVAYVENGLLLQGLLATAALARLAAGLQSGTVDLRLAAMAGAYAGLSCGFKYLAVPMVALPGAAGLIVIMVRTGCRSPAQSAEDSRQRPLRSLRKTSPVPAPRNSATSLVSRSALPRCSAALAVFVLAAALTFSPWLIRNALLTGNPIFPLGYAWFGADEDLWTPDLAERWQRAHRVEPPQDSAAGRLQLLAQRVALDGRLGLLTPLLAAAILCSSRRSPWDLALLVMLAVQLAVWIGWTHLFARFAVPMLIPLVLLGGRAADAGSGRAQRWALGGMLLAALSLSTWQSWSLFATELMPGGKLLPVCGRIELMYEDGEVAELPAFLHQKLLPGSRVLLIGEARAFYLPSIVDYCVVFSRNPFAEAVAAAKDDREIISWLSQRGYTHVVVHWSEMERLRRTYGFWEGIDMHLFERLQAERLTPVRHFSAGNGQLYATCYAIEAEDNPR